MAKRIRFPLEMDNSIQVRTLEELQEHFSLERIMGYYLNGRLMVWLRDRCMDEIADKIDGLDKNEEGFANRLCEVLGVEYQSLDIDLAKLANRNERFAKAKEYTDDENILQNLDSIAFEQDELYERISEGKRVIYLCGEKFNIPLSERGIHYIGVNKPIAVINAQEAVDFDELEIVFDGVEFDEFYQSMLPKMEQARKLHKDKQYEKAMSIFEKLAENGDTLAMSYLGFYYQLGYGVKANIQKAYEWYLNGAKGGNPYAMNKIGSFYQNGCGVIKNYVEAMKWYKKAAEQNYAEAQNNIGVLYYKHHRELGVNLELQDAYELAMEWYLKAANQNYSAAQVNIGNLYYHGHGVNLDHYKALEWYHKAAVQNDAEAYYCIGFLYYNGDSGLTWYDRQRAVSENKEKGVEWFQKAADLNHADAQDYLGLAYYQGHGVEQDYKKAKKWFQRAADNGNVSAMVHLEKYGFA